MSMGSVAKLTSVYADNSINKIIYIIREIVYVDLNISGINHRQGRMNGKDP